MASGPITSWQIDGETVETVSDFIFLDPSYRVMEIKTKINKWNLIKLKRLCTAKETINKT